MLPDSLGDPQLGPIFRVTMEGITLRMTSTMWEHCEIHRDRKQLQVVIRTIELMRGEAEEAM